MEPDRHLWTQSLDQPVSDSGLGLRQGAGPGILGVAGPTERSPAVWEVAIQVHQVGVLPRVRNDAVWI